jgi:HipA-like C-terminal domain
MSSIGGSRPTTVLDVSNWERLTEEPMGEPGKRWLREPETDVKWLFKPCNTQHDPTSGDFLMGEDWAEAIASHAANLLGVPAAHVALAICEEENGAVSRDVTRGKKLTLGNEILFAASPGYPSRMLRGEVAEYTIERIFEAFERFQVSVDELDDLSAKQVFTGYLVLDAWIANQDRHHGNWGILEDPLGDEGIVLAPSFDHGSSLGFQLRDEAREKMLQTSGGVQRWASHGFCRPMAGRPVLVDLATRACNLAGQEAQLWWRRLEGIKPEDVASLFTSIPNERMSPSGRRFAEAVLNANRERLLSAI